MPPLRFGEDLLVHASFAVELSGLGEVAAVYLMLTSLKEVASTKLAGDIGISQKSDWGLDHHIRADLANDGYDMSTS